MKHQFINLGSIVSHDQLPQQKLVSLSSDLRNPIRCTWITLNGDSIDIHEILLPENELNEIRNTLTICSGNIGDKVFHRSNNSILFEILSLNYDSQTAECQLITPSGNEGMICIFSRYEIEFASDIPMPDYLRDPQ